MNILMTFDGRRRRLVKLSLLLVLATVHGLDDCSTNTSVCNAGYRCSPSAGYLCVPCTSGMYCPSGSFISNETDLGLSSITCSSGSYCPTPSTSLPCPAGSFCVSGSSSPTTCSYVGLLASSPTAALVRSPTTALAATLSGLPVMSNVCPAGSSSPVYCPSGYYCPNVTSKIICPSGYFCKAYSAAPTRCPSILSSCPTGTGSPGRSYFAFIIALIVVLALIPIYFSLQYIDRELIIHDNQEREKKPAVLKVIKSMKKSTKSSFHAASETNSTHRAFRNISPSLTLTFDDVGLTLNQPGNKKNVILSKVTGSFEGGQINSILGPSGSGKTIFLSLVSGRINFSCTLNGSVRVNGEIVDHEVLRSITGFVPQDDIVHGDLTVGENLGFAASLKLPINAQEKRDAYVEDAMAILQLGHLRHKLVGSVESRGISGGQRKRVSIGLELVSSPSILFLDEPTSGLDSTAALDVLTSLGELADLGMTIIASVHQPRYNAYSLFDKVLFLAPGGHMVYLGPPSAAASWFSICGFPLPAHENPADYFMDVISGKVRSTAPALFHPSLLPAWWDAHGPDWMGAWEDLNSHRHNGIKLQHYQHKFTPDEMVDLIEEFESLFGPGGVVNEEGISVLFHSPKEDARKLFQEMLAATTVEGAQGGQMDKTRFTQALLLYGTSWGLWNESKGQGETSDEILLPPPPMLSYEIQPLTIEPPSTEEEGAIFEHFDPRPLHDSVAKLSFPSQPRQLVLLLQRSLIKYLRHFWPVRVFDVCILVGAAVIVGLITKTSWDKDAFPGKITLAMACLAVLGTISFCRTFLCDILSLRREVESGISISAYFICLNLIDLFWVFVAPAFFFGPVYYLMIPSQGFAYFYLVGCLVLWWCSGLAYLCVIALPPSAVFMTSVFATLIWGVFANGIVMNVADNRGGSASILALSFNRWSFEILTLKEYSLYLDELRTSIVVEFMNSGLCGLDLYEGSTLELLLTFDINAQCKKYIETAFGALVALGFGLRLAAWIAIKVRMMRTYPKVLLVVLRVSVRAVSRLSSRAISIFPNHHVDQEEENSKDTRLMPGLTLGGIKSNRVAPLDSATDVKVVGQGDCRSIKSEATLDDHQTDER